MGTLSLTDPVNGTPNDATTIANNNAATKAVVNGGIDATNLSDPGSGKVYGSNGGGSAAAVYPPGYEIVNVEFTATVSVGVVTEASSTTIVSAGAVTFDGSAIEVEVYAPAILFASGSVIGDSMTLNLWNDSSELGKGAIFTCQVPDTSTDSYFPLHFKRRFAPSGSHTIALKAFKSTSTATCQVVAGPGGTAAYLPGFIRITKV